MADFPEYPTSIDTPETLLITARMMQDHALKIGAFDWAVALKQIQAALFWAAHIKRLMEDQNEEIRDNERQEDSN